MMEVYRDKRWRLRSKGNYLLCGLGSVTISIVHDTSSFLAIENASSGHT
jgi:hypothetical protein